MIIEICDCFNVSLDYLLREDEKMVRKLNFGIKQKRMLIVLVIILAVLLINTIVGSITFQANPKSLKISDVSIIRDLSYNGEDPNRDWNTSINLNVESKNVFFKPIGDALLVFNDNGNLSLQASWSFSIFNVFERQRTVTDHQTVLIDENVSNNDITLKLHKSEKLIPFHISDINR